MASEIRVDKITSLSGVGTITPSPTGIDIAGITTVATLKATTGIVTTLTATTGIVTTLTANTVTSLGAVSGTTGTFSGDVTTSGGDLTVTGTNPIIHLTDTDDNSDYQLNVNGGVFQVYDYTNSAGRLLVASDGTVSVTNDLSIADKIIHTGDTNTALRFPAADTVSVETGGSERVRVDSNGRILQGSSTGRNTALMAAQATYQLEGVGSNASNFSIFCNSNGTAAGGIEFGKTRGTSTGGTTVVASGDDLGHISFEGSDGSAQRVAARINVQVDGTPGSSDMPGRMRFLTTPDGSATELERFRIESDGDFRLSSGDAGTNYGYIRGWESSTGNMIVGADQSATGSSGSNLIFRTRGGERARIINSGGITFNGDTAAANALDDYEEGTWTPDVVATSGSDSWAYRVAGYYTKVGRLVTVSFSLGQYSGNLSGDIYINNLPFTVGSSFRQYVGDFGWYDVNPPANTCGYFIYLPPNGTNAYPYWTIAGGAGTTVTGAHLYASNRTFWEGNITYVVD